MPRWINAGAAAIVALVVVATLVQDPGGGRAAAAVVALVPEIVLLVRPDLPAWLLLSVTALGVEGLIGDNSASVGVLALLCVAGQAGLFASLRRGWVVLAILAGFLVGHQVADLINGASSGWYLSAVGCILMWGIARLTRRQQQTVVELRQTQHELARVAVAAERERIARDVHDMVAHSLSVTMLHLTGARLALDDELPRARDALEEAERVGRASMAEIRRTVGLLSGRDDPLGVPVPGPSDLADLVDSYRRAGLDVTLHIEGQALGMAPEMGLTLYRLVQESLANVAKHAPDQAAEVTVRIQERTVELTVANPMRDGSATGPGSNGGDVGRGVRGMQERAELAGGHLSAGEQPGRRWVVRGVLPSPREHA